MLTGVSARTKLVSAAIAALLVGLVAALLVIEHQRQDAGPAGYTRIGALGTSVVFAKQSPEGKDVAVVIRRDSDELCNARGPLGGAHPPAICDESVGDVHVYLTQVSKGSTEDPQLCDAITGARLPSEILATPASWSVDFAGSIQDSGTEIEPCTDVS
ncbi:hypothetical protein GCM10022263_37270 [Nocardioides daeguensis]|uniref:Uncharacterized protein n=1 Tax=Nocardioides daeguensis TaxID=908359 RepID=A0ABP6W9D1_9ACTN